MLAIHRTTMYTGRRLVGSLKIDKMYSGGKAASVRGYSEWNRTSRCPEQAPIDSGWIDGAALGKAIAETERGRRPVVHYCANWGQTTFSARVVRRQQKELGPDCQERTPNLRIGVRPQFAQMESDPNSRFAGWVAVRGRWLPNDDSGVGLEAGQGHPCSEVEDQSTER